MSLTRQTVGAFLESVRRPSPTPGGGSASALAGALGASLLAMVATLPKSRAADAADAAQLLAAGERCAALARDLESLVDRDAQAYELVVTAHRLPRSSDGENAARASAIQEALRAAIDAPLAVMRACAAAVEQANVVARFGLAAAASDVRAGLELLGAALRGARANVEINLGGVGESAYAANVRTDVDRLERTAARDAAAAVGALRGA